MHCSFGMSKLISVYDIEQKVHYMPMLYYLNINRSFGMHALANDELDGELTKSPEYMNSFCSQCTNALISICRGFYWFKGSSDRIWMVRQEHGTGETWYIMAFIKLLWFLVTFIQFVRMHICVNCIRIRCIPYIQCTFSHNVTRYKW